MWRTGVHSTGAAAVRTTDVCGWRLRGGTELRAPVPRPHAAVRRSGVGPTDQLSHFRVTCYPRQAHQPTQNIDGVITLPWGHSPGHRRSPRADFGPVAAPHFLKSGRGDVLRHFTVWKLRCWDETGCCCPFLGKQLSSSTRGYRWNSQEVAPASSPCRFSGVTYFLLLLRVIDVGQVNLEEPGARKQ